MIPNLIRILQPQAHLVLVVLLYSAISFSLAYSVRAIQLASQPFSAPVVLGLIIPPLMVEGQVFHGQSRFEYSGTKLWQVTVATASFRFLSPVFWCLISYFLAPNSLNSVYLGSDVFHTAFRAVINVLVGRGWEHVRSNVREVAMKALFSFVILSATKLLCVGFTQAIYYNQNSFMLLEIVTIIIFPTFQILFSLFTAGYVSKRDIQKETLHIYQSLVPCYIISAIKMLRVLDLTNGNNLEYYAFNTLSVLTTKFLPRMVHLQLLRRKRRLSLQAVDEDRTLIIEQNKPTDINEFENARPMTETIPESSITSLAINRQDPNEMSVTSKPKRLSPLSQVVHSEEIESKSLEQSTTMEYPAEDLPLPTAVQPKDTKPELVRPIPPRLLISMDSSKSILIPTPVILTPNIIDIAKDVLGDEDVRQRVMRCDDAFRDVVAVTVASAFSVVFYKDFPGIGVDLQQIGFRVLSLFVLSFVFEVFTVAIEWKAGYEPYTLEKDLRGYMYLPMLLQAFAVCGSCVQGAEGLFPTVQ